MPLDWVDRLARGIAAGGNGYLLALCILVIGAMGKWVARQSLRHEREAKQREKDADEDYARRELASAEESRRREQGAKDETRALAQLALRMATGVDDTKAVLLKLQEHMEALERRQAETERLIRERIKPVRPP